MQAGPQVGGDQRPVGRVGDQCGHFVAHIGLHSIRAAGGIEMIEYMLTYLESD